MYNLFLSITLNIDLKDFSAQIFNFQKLTKKLEQRPRVALRINLKENKNNSFINTHNEFKNICILFQICIVGIKSFKLK